MENIMVAGGAGFIVSNLCDFLLVKGESVVCVGSTIIDPTQDATRFRGC